MSSMLQRLLTSRSEIRTLRVRLCVPLPEPQRVELQAETLPRETEGGGRAGPVAAVTLQRVANVGSLELPSREAQALERASAAALDSRREQVRVQALSQGHGDEPPHLVLQ